MDDIINEKIVKLRQAAAAKVLERFSSGDLYTRAVEYINKNSLQYVTYNDYCNMFNSRNIKGFDSFMIMMMKTTNERSLLTTKEFLEICKGITDKLQTYTDLLTYTSIPGYITEKELQDYIYDLIPNLKALKRLPESFQPYYTLAATRRFMFFLDNLNHNRISVYKLVNSEVLEEFIYLNRLMLSENEMDPATLVSRMNSNWFNGNNAWNLYTTFLKLDLDKNGTLNRAELMAYSNPKDNPPLKLTESAIIRIFEVLSADGYELDYKGFIDFVLLIENRSSSKSKKFFWRLLDIDSIEEGGTGTLTTEVISHFYYDIGTGLIDLGCDVPALDNIIIELNDVLGCPSSIGICYEDVMRSSQGHTVMLMLLDVNAFWAYDNRESLLKDEDDTTEDK